MTSIAPPRIDAVRTAWRRTVMLLEVENLVVEFPRNGQRGHFRAVDDVSLALRAGVSFGLVGESGSGKSTLARAILRLLPCAAGRIRFDGGDLLALRGRALRAVRRELQIVFQDTSGSLNPRRTIGSVLAEPLRVHGLVASAAAARRRVAELLALVGLPPEAAERYPHEFSGGQRQRIGIARALVLEPRLVVLDEPVSALDVSIQAQVLNLLADLRARLGLSYLFISHNLAVVRHFCEEAAVMRHGRIVEINSTAKLFTAPRATYTQELIASIPRPATAPRRP